MLDAYRTRGACKRVSRPLTVSWHCGNDECCGGRGAVRVPRGVPAKHWWFFLGGSSAGCPELVPALRVDVAAHHRVGVIVN